MAVEDFQVSKPSNKALRKAALKIAEQGQPVFPCRTEGKKAKRPFTRNGLHDASTDPEMIDRWWRQHKGAAIGVPTGVQWDVLDVDVKAAVDGRVHLPYLNRLGLLNGCQRVAQTPSGGWHLYFKATPGVTNRSNAGLGLDVRGLGGYVLAPPSYIDTDDYAGTYEDHGKTKGSNDEPLLWNLIVSALQPMNTVKKEPVPLLPSERRASVAHLREWLLNRQSGERNNSLHWTVCRCIEDGIDPHEMVEPALEIGLDEEEVLATIGSALRRAGVKAEDLQSEADALFGDL